MLNTVSILPLVMLNTDTSTPSIPLPDASLTVPFRIDVSDSSGSVEKGILYVFAYVSQERADSEVRWIVGYMAAYPFTVGVQTSSFSEVLGEALTLLENKHC